MNVPVGFKTIFRTVAGSNLYGTNTVNSDYDERGVFIPSKEYFYGFLNRIEQLEDTKNNDIVYYELRKFLSLAVDNNPNIIELLFVPPSMWLYHSTEWLQIYDKYNLFLSKKCKHTFSGYAISQYKRIKLHRNWLLNPPKCKPTRTSFGLSENRADLSKDQIGAMNELLAMKLQNITEFHPLREELIKMNEQYSYRSLCNQSPVVKKENIRKLIPISDHFIEILQKENAYTQASREYNQYEDWKKNRNPARAELELKYGYDTKFVMHCFRLLSEGRELLEKGYITFPRPDAKYLMEVRDGLFSYDELSDILEKSDEKFNEWYKNSTLPEKPNRTAVDKLCIDIIENYLNNGGKNV